MAHYYWGMKKSQVKYLWWQAKYLWCDFCLLSLFRLISTPLPCAISFHILNHSIHFHVSVSPLHIVISTVNFFFLSSAWKSTNLVILRNYTDPANHLKQIHLGYSIIAPSITQIHKVVTRINQIKLWNYSWKNKLLQNHFEIISRQCWITIPREPLSYFVFLPWYWCKMLSHCNIIFI